MVKIAPIYGALCAVCLLFLGGIPAPAQTDTAGAKTYYLDATNGLDAGDGSQAKPWKSFGQAQTALRPGDTLCCTGELGLIKMGQGDPTGTPEQWITYRNWEGKEMPLIKALVFDGIRKDRFLLFQNIRFSPGEVDAAGYNENNTIYLGGAWHVAFDGCDIEGCKLRIPEGAIDPALGFAPYTPVNPQHVPAITAGNPGDASHITIRKCRIRYSGIAIGIMENPRRPEKQARHWTIVDNEITDASEDGIRFGGRGGSNSLVARNFIHDQVLYRSGFFWRGKASPSIEAWQKHKWAPVTQDETGAKGVFYQTLDVKGTMQFYILASDRNHLPTRKSTTAWRLDSDREVFFQPNGTGDNTHTDGVAIQGPSENVIFEGNRIEGSSYGGGLLKLENIGGHPKNFLFRNNLFYAKDNPGGASLFILAGGSNCVFVHNTIYTGPNGKLPGGIRFNDLAGEGFDGIYFYNNIISGGGVSNRNEVNLGYSDYNLWLSPPLPGFRKGEHDVVLPGGKNDAARFVDAAAGDLRLLPDSPAAGIGSPAHATEVDLDRVPRSNPPDAGAYEIKVPAPVDQ